MFVSCHQYNDQSGWDVVPSKSLDSDNTLMVIFGPSDFTLIESELNHLRETFKSSRLIGCSTSGEIYGRLVSDDSLVVALIKFEKSRIKISSHELDQAMNSLLIGEKIAEDLYSGDLKGMLVLSDGLNINGSELVRGIAKGNSHEVNVAGGLAGDGQRFEKTWTLVDGQIKENNVTAVGFYGEHVHMDCQFGGGWDVLGPERVVTSSKNNILYALDGQPALDLYKKYLGDRASGLPATGLLFPLSIRNSEEQKDITVRTILGINEDDKSIRFAGDIPQGSKVRLMRANNDRLIDGASDGARIFNQKAWQDKEVIFFAVSCVGRRLVLGQRIEEELEAVIDELSMKNKLVGFYSYGEISTDHNKRCDLHNQTISLTAVWEA